MKIAAIDLGTNTFHLIIAEVVDHQINVIYKTNQAVRLGEEITKNNLIIPAAFERGISCLLDFKNELNKHQIIALKATGTSAIRSAINGQEFVAAAYHLAGIKIDIIDGAEEALLIYEGVKLSGAIKEKSLIMDIGGGSTEFILCDENELIWKKSFDIGAARLMQHFFKSDPINAADQTKLNKYIKETLEDLVSICKIHQPKLLIGSAGAFETFAIMTNPKLNLNELKTHEIDLNSYKKLVQQLIQANHQERANMENLIPLRVDMIVMASILSAYVIEKIKIERLILSTYDLKMGILSGLRIT